MAKEPWSKGRVGKIKNSPAVQAWKESEGSVGKFVDKTLDYVFPNSNVHQDTGTGRSAEWNHGLHSHLGKDDTCATCAIGEMQGN